MKDWHVGQRVVCIDDEPGNGTIWCNGEEPKEGKVYTIRRVYTAQGSLRFWLDEICRADDSIAEHGVECGYGARRFRPVDERKIDCFRKHLTKIDNKQTEDA